MRKYYPKIEFKINQKLEKEFFSIFGNDKKAIASELVFLLDKSYSKSKQTYLNSYVDNYYLLHGDDVIDNVKKVKEEWEKVALYFYKQVDIIFHNYPWPKGKYFGYYSIWKMFPRFISKKYFTFPAIKRNGNGPVTMAVIAHEMLHFITYDYLRKRYKLKPSEYNDRDNTFWQFTENLNVLIERSDAWRKISKTSKFNNPYPQCQKLFARMEKIWQENNDLDNLIIKTFKIK